MIFRKEKTHKIVMNKSNIFNWIPAKKVTIKRDGVLLSVPTVIDYMLFVNVDWENEEKEFALMHSQDDKVILDIGSNVGYYTSILANKYQNSKIISLEASPSIFDILSYNCKLNKFSNVVLYNNAVTEKDDIEMNFSKRDSMFIIDNTILSDLGVPENQIKKEKTTTITIDTLVKNENLGKIQFCKIDIEEAEVLALKGAQLTLKKK